MYWSRASSSILSSIKSEQPLHAQMQHGFSRTIIPNWQDSSTTAECRAMESAIGSAAQLARATGSKAHERFTGAQIMRWKSADPDAYDNTHRISLVSSFITTLLCLDGEVKGIDESDACGMNLWSMQGARGWNRDVLKAISGSGAAELERKLGKVETDGGRVVGHIGKWFVERYGFNPDCCVFPGTGDNPATFLSSTRESLQAWLIGPHERGPPIPWHFRRPPRLYRGVQSPPRVSRLLPPRADRSAERAG